MKTKEELNALKNEIDTLNKKLAELTQDELDMVVGGHDMPRPNPDEKYVIKGSAPNNGINQYEFNFYSDKVDRPWEE